MRILDALPIDAGPDHFTAWMGGTEGGGVEVRTLLRLRQVLPFRKYMDGTVVVLLPKNAYARALIVPAEGLQEIVGGVILAARPAKRAYLAGPGVVDSPDRGSRPGSLAGVHAMAGDHARNPIFFEPYQGNIVRALGIRLDLQRAVG